MGTVTEKTAQIISDCSPCRVRRYAMVEITSQIIHADEPELALLALDHMVDYDQLLRNKTGRKIIESIKFLYLDGADIEYINLGELDPDLDPEIQEGKLDLHLEEQAISALKKKFAPGRRKSKPSSGKPKSPSGKGH